MSTATGIRPITDPLPGERVLALSPPDANAAATTWLRRPRLFAGRALTAPTLEQNQKWQSGHIAQRAQTFTSGVVRGLEAGYVSGFAETGPTPVTVHVAAGRGLSLNGEDVVLPRAIECDWYALPVIAPPELLAPPAESEESDEEAGSSGVLLPRALIRRPAAEDGSPGSPFTLGDLLADFPNALPPAGVLLLQPVRYDLSDADPADPCDQCPCGPGITRDSLDDWRTVDAVRLVWYAWPSEWRALPAAGPTQRNALAYKIFEAERTLPADTALPWEEWGVPVALIGVDPGGIDGAPASYTPLYADRNAVVRRAGRARDDRVQAFLPAEGSPLQVRANARLPALWQAQLEQFAEQVAGFGEDQIDPQTLAGNFSLLPPAGLLPKNCMDLGTQSSGFFPSGFELDAVPVPMTELDAAIRASASLAPLDLNQPERLRVLVPVSEASFEPRLLLTEIIDPLFQQTVDRCRIDRAQALVERQGLRLSQFTLGTAIRGSAVPVPAISDDPQALEPEALAPWGPPPPGGGHRGALRAGYHQHFFVKATPLAVAADDSLYVWVQFDPDNTPRSLLLQWHSVDNSWEHRAYWGENLFAFGVDGTGSLLRIGDLPTPGQWLRLEIPAAAVGLGRLGIDGISFGVHDGRVAFGASGRAPAGGADAVWFSDRFPAGSTLERQGDYPWDFLGSDDLWTPFAEDFSYTPDPGDAPAAAGIAAAPARAPKAFEALLPLTEDGPLGALSAAERAKLTTLGLEGFIAMLKSRADRADDIVDFGFTKVQTDIYRVRQLVLGNVEATRLAISPTLANIAKTETATASQQQVSDFLKNLKLPFTPGGT